jgi:hypothetical protein
MKMKRLNNLISTKAKHNCAMLFIFLCLSCMFCIVLIPGTCAAWEQDEHEAINQLAFEKFILLYSHSDKFKNSPLDVNAGYPGPYTTSASSLISGDIVNAIIPEAQMSSFQVENQTHTALDWIMHGGFAADEPEIYASLRHFYDPTAEDGRPELTDVENLHFLYDNTVSAFQWAYTHPDNAFSFMNGLACYKKSMEIAENGRYPSLIPQIGGDGSFRDMEFTPENREEERQFYLGKALRALGESMHMISDMAMPAHVRNDAHPLFDSIETPLKPSMIYESAIYDAQPEVDLTGTPMQNFVELAKYTNAHFYSNETIYDKEKGVTPWNDEKKYPKPQLSDYELTDFVMIDHKDKATYYQLFSIPPYRVPMVVETRSLGSGILGDVWSLEHTVPAEFGQDYCNKLVPLAIKASYRTMYEFFPILECSIDGEYESANEDEARIGMLGKIRLNAELIHKTDKDRAWIEARLEIKYSGPGVLFKQSKEGKTKIADVIFEDGKMTKINTSKTRDVFSDIDGPVTLYIWDSGRKVSAPADFPDALDINDFIISNGERVILDIFAGGRDFSALYLYEEKEIELSFYQDNYEVDVSEPITLTAIARNAPRNVSYAWNFGNGQTANTRVANVNPVYEKAGNYLVILEMRDMDSYKTEPIAYATTEVTVKDHVTNPWIGTWQRIETVETLTDSGMNTVYGWPSGPDVIAWGDEEESANDVEYASLDGSESALTQCDTLVEIIDISAYNTDGYEYKIVYSQKQFGVNRNWEEEYVYVGNAYPATTVTINETFVSDGAYTYRQVQKDVEGTLILCTFDEDVSRIYPWSEVYLIDINTIFYQNSGHYYTR